MFSLHKFSCISNKETPASFACKHRIDLRPRSTIFMGKIRVKKPFGCVIHFLLNSVTCQPRLSLRPRFPSYPGSWSIYLPFYQEISDQKTNFFQTNRAGVSPSSQTTRAQMCFVFASSQMLTKPADVLINIILKTLCKAFSLIFSLLFQKRFLRTRVNVKLSVGNLSRGLSVQ